MSNTEELDIKEQISLTFLRHFQEYGMRRTIVADVAKELGISKKTIYKYFSGGKSDALYYFFNQIAQKYVSRIEDEILTLSPKEKLNYIIRQIFAQGRPFILANVAETEEDYNIENQIVGRAFKDAYQDLFRDILQEGIKKGFYSDSLNLDLYITFIYGIILEAMKIVYINLDYDIEKDVIEAVHKLLAS